MAPAKAALALLVLYLAAAGEPAIPEDEEAMLAPDNVFLLQDGIKYAAGGLTAAANQTAPESAPENQTAAEDKAVKASTEATKETAPPPAPAPDGSNRPTGINFRNVVAEFLAMTLFVFVGCGSAMSIAKAEGSAWVFQVALTFGLAISCLAYTVGHYSGAQINCAVTLGLVIYGNIGALQGLMNFLGQLVGAVLGAAILKAMYPLSKDCTGGLGCNGVAEGWTQLGALVGEFMGTFLLMYVVLETAVNSMASSNSSVAPLAIGFAVFLAHSVLIPIDGCSINPTRSFGPALVQSIAGGGGAPWKDMWVFWVGPLLGASAATGVYALMC